MPSARVDMVDLLAAAITGTAIGVLQSAVACSRRTRGRGDDLDERMTPSKVVAVATPPALADRMGRDVRAVILQDRVGELLQGARPTLRTDLAPRRA